MNRLQKLFDTKPSGILNIYFTAGFPNLSDTQTIILELDKAGADLIEIGMPYSDPLADGPVIQQSSERALENGMNLDLLFSQVKNARKTTQTPLILMGYFNQMLQYGVDKFLGNCADSGIDGLILPDMPLDDFETIYKSKFEDNNLTISFLVTPQTSETRINTIDKLTSGFVYLVSSASVTGAKTGIDNQQIQYFERMKNRAWRNPTLIGFGISDAATFNTACQYANGAIIGSAFIKMLDKSENMNEDIHRFVNAILKA